MPLDLRPRVYVAGPYTDGDPVLNVRQAVSACQALYDAGYVPFCPHLYHLWHTIAPADYEQWMDLCLSWIETCDLLLLLPGDSPGAAREVAKMRSLGRPVYTDPEALMAAHPTTPRP